MKSFRIDDQGALSAEAVLQAIYAPSLGKRTRNDVVRVLANTDYYTTQVQEMIHSGRFKPRRHEVCIINEVGPHKIREIIKPDYYPEQIVHHIAVAAIKDSILSGMSPFVLGSIPGRGAHYGKKYIQKWIRNDPRNTKIVGKLDIRHFFQSIDHDILRAWLHKKFRPGEIRDLLDVILEAADQGIPLGYYTSQWFANFLLQPLDHYIKEELHVPHMTRYIDDIVIFGSSKKQIHEAMDAIDLYLWKNYKLTVKKNWQVFRLAYETEEIAITCGSLAELYDLEGALWAKKIKHRSKLHRGKRKLFVSLKTYERRRAEMDRLIKSHSGTVERLKVCRGRPLDYMGFKFYRNRTTLRKSIMLRATRKAKQIGRAVTVCWKQAAAMLSYMGWITHTNTYAMYMDRIEPYVDVRRMKRIISKHTRRLIEHDNQVVPGGRHTGRGAGCPRQDQLVRPCLST